MEIVRLINIIPGHTSFEIYDSDIKLIVHIYNKYVSVHDLNAMKVFAISQDKKILWHEKLKVGICEFDMSALEKAKSKGIRLNEEIMHAIEKLITLQIYL